MRRGPIARGRDSHGHLPFLSAWSLNSDRRRKSSNACERCHPDLTILQLRTQQCFEQGLPGRETAKQRGQPDIGSAGDIPHGGIGTILGDNLARDRKEAAVILAGISSHSAP